MTIQFGTDGWRGVIADDFTFASVRLVARAAAVVLCKGVAGNRRAVTVGFDRRFESDRFARAVVNELAAGGVDVFLCPDPTPTPVVSFAAHDRGAMGALVVTASHNPAIYNGIKLKSAGGAASPAIIEEIEAELANPSSVPDCDPGRIENIDPFPAYFSRLGKLVDLPRLRAAGLTVVVDPMFGTASGVLSTILDGDATQVIEINTAHNPLFPGITGPDPVARNLGRIKKVVMDGSATLGIAFDGDADRLAVIDNDGNLVSPQLIFAVLARYVLDVRHKRGPLVKSAGGTNMIDRLAEHYNVPVVQTRTGFMHVSKAMVDEGAAMAGEESGGYAFGFHLPDRDGILSTLLLLDYLVHSGKSLGQLIADLQVIVGQWSSRRVDLPLSREGRAALTERVRELQWPPTIAGLHVRNVSPGGQRVEFADGSWVLARPSGTEPVLRLYAEAKDPETVDNLLDDLRAILAV